MSRILFGWVIRIVSLTWLTGPIFDKELRVSSRRRRNYVLRFAYVVLFGFLLGLIWLQHAFEKTSVLYLSSRMAQAGLSMMILVTWFQFLAAQAIAVVMLSTSISDEIYHRTLGTLMTTPIGSFQIVVGKLLSKLLQLGLLLAITLPLLAVVRVFGGIPWTHLIVSLCVTLTTVIFVGSLSLLFSIFTRRAYTVIIAAILTLVTLFAALPLLAALALHDRMDWQRFNEVLACVNPYVLMANATERLVRARPLPVAHWALHCGLMLAASFALLGAAMLFVRRAALRQAAGESGWTSGSRRKGSADHPFAGAVRRVRGPVVLWKERRAPLLGKARWLKVLAGVVALGLLLLTYALCASQGLLTDHETHFAFAIVFTLAGLLFTAVLPATAITAEKESRTWPLLLTTPLGNWQILAGKFAGAVRRCLPVWLLLFLHVIVFAVLGIVHPLALVQLGIMVGWATVFLCSAGLYFSTRLRHTTAAVIANMALAVGLWVIVPFLMVLTRAVTHAGEDLLELYIDTHPLVQVGVVMMAAEADGLGHYDWAQGQMGGAAEATAWIGLTFVMHVVIALLFLARAGARLRRCPF